MNLPIGLALSGGGFRATLFHIGSLVRINELGLLKKISIITSVSGGSIASGRLAAAWNDLQFDGNGVATNFQQQVVEPLWDFCNHTIDVGSFLAGLIPFTKTRADQLADHYETLTKGKRLQDLPDDGQGPRFVFYATNLQTGSSFRFQKSRIADYKIGEIPFPKDYPISKAVAASSAFPPLFSPVKLTFDPALWKNFTNGPAKLFDNKNLKSSVILCDGGVYDNMGLEEIWDRCDTVLVSDGGAPLGLEESPSVGGQMGRVRDILIEQTRALRKRWLVTNFQGPNPVRKGTYWGITTLIGDYALADAYAKDNAVTAKLKEISTRLAAFSEHDRSCLVNWGYALTDAGLRKYVSGILPPGSSAPTAWPIKGFPL